MSPNSFQVFNSNSRQNIFDDNYDDSALGDDEDEFFGLFNKPFAIYILLSLLLLILTTFLAGKCWYKTQIYLLPVKFRVIFSEKKSVILAEIFVFRAIASETDMYSAFFKLFSKKNGWPKPRFSLAIMAIRTYKFLGMIFRTYKPFLMTPLYMAKTLFIKSIPKNRHKQVPTKRNDSYFFFISHFQNDLYSCVTIYRYGLRIFRNILSIFIYQKVGPNGIFGH